MKLTIGGLVYGLLVCLCSLVGQGYLGCSVGGFKMVI